MKVDWACFSFSVVDTWSHRWSACQHRSRISRLCWCWGVNLKTVSLTTRKLPCFCQTYLVPNANNPYLLLFFDWNSLEMPEVTVPTCEILCLLIFKCQISSPGHSKSHMLHKDWCTTCGFSGDEGFVELFSILSLSRRVGLFDNSKAYHRFVEVRLCFTFYKPMMA